MIFTVPCLHLSTWLLRKDTLCNGYILLIISLNLYYLFDHYCWYDYLLISNDTVQGCHQIILKDIAKLRKNDAKIK